MSPIDDLERRLRRDLHAAAGDPKESEPLTDDLRRRVRHARRRRFGLAAGAATVVIVAVVAAVAAGSAPSHRQVVHTVESVTTDTTSPQSVPAPTVTAPTSSLGPNPNNTTTSETTTSTTPTTSAVTTPTSATTTPTINKATVPGGPNGEPPCATGDGSYGADISHPERAPLQAQATFGTQRWAICGADTASSDELLNLRSSDSDTTWTVTDTGLAISPHHAGDRVDIQLRDATHATMRLVSPVASRDDTYTTDDGGLTWST